MHSRVHAVMWLAAKAASAAADAACFRTVAASLTGVRDPTEGR